MEAIENIRSNAIIYVSTYENYQAYRCYFKPNLDI